MHRNILTSQRELLESARLHRKVFDRRSLNDDGPSKSAFSNKAPVDIIEVLSDSDSDVRNVEDIDTWIRASPKKSKQSIQSKKLLFIDGSSDTDNEGIILLYVGLWTCLLHCFIYLL